VPSTVVPAAMILPIICLAPSNRKSRLKTGSVGFFPESGKF
jgi:hypothetical protein